MPNRVRLAVERNVPVPMRDGIILYADIYRPAGEGSYPVLLQRTPYNKSDPLVTSSEGDALRFAEAGYAVVIQDVRGRYASQGEFYVLENESHDGYDTVGWCAAQPWSSGKVGMFGASYAGATQWLAAITQPPHLVTIIPAMAFSDCRQGWTYEGGAFVLGLTLSWTLVYLARDTAFRKLNSLPDGESRLDGLTWAVDHLSEVFRRLPLTNQPELEGVAPYYFDWLAHPDEDDYWRRWDIEASYDRISIPALNVGGWYDIFLRGTLHNFSGVRERATPEARQGQRLLIGPWSHDFPWMDNLVGDVDFGFASSGPGIDFNGLQIRWFDRYLRDVENDFAAAAPVHIFVMGSNVWRSEQEWPLARTRYTNYYMHSAGCANSLHGDGTLTTQAPQDEPPDSYLYNPRDPVPTGGGAVCCSPIYTQGGAFDQRHIESRADVLVYTTALLTEELEVTGPIRLTLFASTSAPDTDWTAKLVDVGPNGFARNLTEGIVRARYRDSSSDPTLLEPGQTYEYSIDLWGTSNVYKAGHRIRVEISSSNFPRFDRNPGTGEPAEFCSALQHVFHDTMHPSRITLPVIAQR